jgi:AmiR/NasT family two-component response regulator
LADVATIGILQYRAAQESQMLTGQLEHALASRVVIEQAKGVIAHTLDLDMDQAFDRLRRYSRNHNERLADVARDIVSRRFSATELE